MTVIRTWLRRLFFHFWYFRSPPWDSGITPSELMAFIQKKPPGRALDLGCGTGTNVLTLARHGWEAQGVDFAPRAIALAEEKARSAGVAARFTVDDVTQLKSAQGRFDLVLDMGCFHNLSPAGRRAYVQRVLDLLQPGATYLLYAFLRPESKEITTENRANADERFELGMTEAEIQTLSRALHLENRLDTTERGKHPSVWLEFTRGE